MNLRNVILLGIKELRGLWRDPVMMILIVYSFTFSIYTSAKAIPESLADVPISIVDGDQSILSGRIASAFYPPAFVGPRMISAAEMDRRMDEGLDTFALDIPAGFERDLLAGHRPAVQLNVDATRMSQAFTGSGQVARIVTGEVSEFLSRHRADPAPPVDLALRARYNPALDPGWFGPVASLMDMITMLTTILTGAALIREKEHGTVEHLLAMPVTPAEIMLSKIWSMGLVVFLGAGIALALVVQGALGIPVQGSAALFMAGVALMLFSTTSLGIFLATAAGTMPQFALLIMLVITPLQILSGGQTPRESMPDIIQNLMLAAPNTHFVIMSQAVLFRGAGLSVVWPQFAALAVIGAALFWLALRQFRRFLR